MSHKRRQGSKKEKDGRGRERERESERKRERESKRDTNHRTYVHKIYSKLFLSVTHQSCAVMI